MKTLIVGLGNIAKIHGCLLRVDSSAVQGYYENGIRSVIEHNPEVMGGSPVFRGTRVPLQTLLDYVEAGQTITEFLEGFPTMTREQVIAFLEEAKEKVLAST